MVKHNDFVGGQYIWTGFDYIGEPTPYGFPARSSYFGIIDLAGFPKDTYYMYQSEWTQKPMLHLFPHWNWVPGDYIDMWCYYSGADEVELFINGKSQGVRRKTDHQPEGWKPGLCTEYHVGWRVTFDPGEVKAVSRKDGKVVCEQVIKTAGAPDHIRLTTDYKGKTIKVRRPPLSLQRWWIRMVISVLGLMMRSISSMKAKAASWVPTMVARPRWNVSLRPSVRLSSASVWWWQLAMARLRPSRQR